MVLVCIIAGLLGLYTGSYAVVSFKKGHVLSGIGSILLVCLVALCFVVVFGIS